MTSMTITETSTRTIPEVVECYIDNVRTTGGNSPVRTKTRATTAESKLAFAFGNMSMPDATITNPNSLGAAATSVFQFPNPDRMAGATQLGNLDGLVTATNTTPTVIVTTRNPMDPGEYSNAISRNMNRISKEEQQFAKQKTVTLEDFR